MSTDETKETNTEAEAFDWLNDAVKGKEQAQTVRKQAAIVESRPRGEAKQALQRRLDTETTQEDKDIAGIEVVDGGYDVTKEVQRRGLPDAWEDSPHTADVINALIRFLNSPLIIDKFMFHSDKKSDKLLADLLKGKIKPQDIKVRKDTPRRQWELKQSRAIQDLLKNNRISVNALNKVINSINTIEEIDWEDLVLFAPEYKNIRTKADNLKALFEVLLTVVFDGLPLEVKLRTTKLTTDLAQELLQVFGYKVTQR